MRRVFIMRNLRKCNCSLSLMMRAYFAFLRSVLLYAYPCLCNAPSYLQKRLLRVEKRVAKIIGVEITPSLLDAADASCSKLLSVITRHRQHPLRALFQTKQRTSRTHPTQVLRRGFTRTERFSSSFIKYAE